MYKQRDPEGTEVQFLQDFVPFDGAHVLEIGAGDGRLTWRYAPFARRVTGIDPNAARLSQALAARPPELAQAVSFIRTEAQQLPFVNRQFDAALFAWSL